MLFLAPQEYTQMNKLLDGKKLLTLFILKEATYPYKYGIVVELPIVNYKMENKFGHHHLLLFEAQFDKQEKKLMKFLMK